MGLFFNYSKPGPGVSKDERKKKGIALYFQLFFRHFWDFMKENMLYVLTSVPMLLVVYLCFTFFDVLGIQSFIIENDLLLAYETVKVFFAVLFVILCGSGPASAGMAHMMRCVTREEHCFLWSDFWEKFRENFKNSIIIAIADIVILMFVAPIAIRFYYMQYAQSAQSIWLMIAAIVFIIMILYIMMHMYFYQFIITFDLKFFTALKNSMLVTMGYLPLNLIIIAIPVVLTYILSSYINPMFVLIFAVIFWVSFMRYPMEFLASRIIDKKLIKAQAEKAEE